MSAAQRVLDRLPRVKQTRPGSYITGCPCCKSREGRPIKVDERDDGRVLIYAFCGCTTADVVGEIGLTLGDLFDKPLAQHLPPVRGGFNARELLELVHHEVTVAAILATDMESRQLTADKATRLRQCSARIGKAHALIDGR
jgi:hypothetical protein